MNSALLILAGALWLIWVTSFLVFGRRRAEFHVGFARDFFYPVAALVVVVAWLLSDPTSAFGGLLSLYIQVGLLIAAWLTLIWLISLVMRDASIMDIAYALTALLPVTVLVGLRGTWSTHEIFTLALVGLWSARLSIHIGARNLSKGEDGRYAAWRRRFGRHWWWFSLFQVFALQGVLIWLWSFCLIMAVGAAPAALGWQHILALLLFALGFAFQAGSDIQLERFKKNRKDRSQVLDSGLWSLSRHPNYFGEVMIWWSFGALGLVHPWGWIALASPLYVTWFMVRGSATPLIDRYLAKTKPAYAAYMARVPAFFPWSKP